jgi:hypothetical protein
VNKDEIDLSVYPSYLGVRAGAEAQESAKPREAVMRGLIAAGLVGLVGVLLGVVVWRLFFRAETLSPITCALTSGAMVFVYTRAAGAAPRRGLLPLVVMLLAIMGITYFAVLMAKAWWVYSLLEEDFHYLGFSRGSFVLDVVIHPHLTGILDDLLFMSVLFTICGSCLALWKVRRRTEA